MKLLGIDDAGRGPVIGPMVLAGVLIDPSQESEIKSLGAKDSKLLAPTKRKQIKQTLEKFPHKIITSSPQEIDAHENLNTLEAEKTAQIINHLSKQTTDKIQVIVDCPSTNIQAWTQTVQDILTKTYQLPATSYQLSCEHKADYNHPIVSAASILAKEKREDEIKSLKQKFNIDFGSGYPADPKTKTFIEKNHDNPKFKELIRFSWNTVKKLQRYSNQKKLF